MNHLSLIVLHGTENAVYSIEEWWNLQGQVRPIWNTGHQMVQSRRVSRRLYNLVSKS